LKGAPPDRMFFLWVEKGKDPPDKTMRALSDLKLRDGQGWVVVGSRSREEF
jgi:hypothetical protein